MLNIYIYNQEYQPESLKLSNLNNSSAPDHIHRDARYLSLGFGEFYHSPKQKIAKSNIITQSESSHLLLVEVEIQNYPLCLCCDLNLLWIRVTSSLRQKQASDRLSSCGRYSGRVADGIVISHKPVSPLQAFDKAVFRLTPMMEWADTSSFQHISGNFLPRTHNPGPFFVGKCAIKSGNIVPEDSKTLTFNRSALLSLCTKIFRLWLLIHASLEDEPLLQRLHFADWSVQILQLTQTWQHATVLSNVFL